MKVAFDCSVCGDKVSEDDVYILTLPDDSGMALCSPQCIFAWAQVQSVKL